jgi:hypothetical protein
MAGGADACGELIRVEGVIEKLGNGGKPGNDGSSVGDWALPPELSPPVRGLAQAYAVPDITITADAAIAAHLQPLTPGAFDRPSG